jgi:methylenetetrahydrofolate dehydrogenase (NADP+)/methenyltetrahydrofolate cyclohydrolase
MDTRILEGRKIAREIQAEAAREVEELAERGIVPGLAVVLLGDDPASQVYVRNKVRTCRELGMHSEQYALPSETRNDELLSLIDRLNADNNIDGILVQLPLPEHIEEKAVLERISPEKDVDGLHPVNVGRLVTGDYVLAPCTPVGILEMLRREGVAFKGAEAVVVGRSNIVGKPMALLLLHQHATVTICHSRTRRLAEVCRRADILVVAVGRPALITREYIREGAVVVDVGTNHLENEDDVRRLFGDSSPRLARFRERGSVLVGDVHPRDPLGIAAAVTPVPGGVGPLTIAQLMKNTVLACRARRG